MLSLFFPIESHLKDSDDETEMPQGTTDKSKDYSSFFMTQVDQDEATLEVKKPPSQKKTADTTAETTKKSNAKKENALSASVDNIEKDPIFKNYEILLHIENEDQIKVPKDLGGSVRALKQMLTNPLVFRDPCVDLDKPQVPVRTFMKVF